MSEERINIDGGERARQQQQQQQQQQVQIPVDASGLTATYANFFRVTGTPEELVLDFGLNTQQMAQERPGGSKVVAPPGVELLHRETPAWRAAMGR